MTMNYKIPEEILSKIPEYFWPAFVGELVSTFGLVIFEKDPETESLGLNFIGGTSGWHAAFKMACDKLDLGWLYEYYCKLRWLESDMFDGEFEDLIISKFLEADNLPASTYYAWLIRR